MAGIRKTPKLRKDGRYYVASIYKPNGQRTNISFGCADEHTVTIHSFAGISLGYGASA